MGMNYEVARRNMVEQQVRTWEVLEPRVLDVLGAVPREDFVNPRYRKMAYADTALPLDHDQRMMKPVVEARLMQALNPQPSETVLEIGTGSGYLAACLSRLAGQVTSIDCVEAFVNSARRRLESVEADNVGVHHLDVFSQEAVAQQLAGQTFDAIAVTGSARTLPEQFHHLLHAEGRLFMVVGDEPAMEACLFRRVGTGGWAVESLFETDLGRLIGAEDQPTFEW